MVVSAYTMGSIFQAMPDNSILQCSVWKPSWTSFSFPAGVGNYGALTIRRSTVNAGSLQYHDLDNNIVYTRSKYGGVWNPSADAAPWEQLVNNSKISVTVLSTTATDITTTNKITLTDDVRKYDKIDIQCWAIVNSTDASRKFMLSDTYHAIDAGQTNRYICGGLYYNQSYYCSLGLDVSSDGKVLTKREHTLQGYTTIYVGKIFGYKLK